MGMADTPTPSLADSLRETRDKFTEEREPKTFKLPGYGRKLQVKYRVLSREERKELVTSTLQQARAENERAGERGMAATLARACIAFYTDRDGETVLLNEAENLGEDPIRWGDDRLAGLFGMEVEGVLRARDVIEYVFGQNDDALEEHHNEVSRWMEKSWEEDDSDF